MVMVKMRNLFDIGFVLSRGQYDFLGMVLLLCRLINPARVRLFLFWYDSLMHFYLLTCIATRHAPIVGVCKERHVPKQKNISVYICLHEVMIFRIV